jgi:hypothetical protein
MFPQACETREIHVPEKSCNLAPEELKLLPTELRVTLTDVEEVNTNLYQTSSSGVPVAHPILTPVLAVAPLTVSPVKGTPILNSVAPEQSSLPRGGNA